MSYTPDVYHQLDGSAFQQANCVPSTGTMLMDRASAAKWRVAAPKLRTMSGDTSGGLTYSQIAPVVAKATANEVVPTVITTDRAGLKALIVAGHGAGVSILCSVTVNTPYHTGSYTGGHSIYVNAWRYNATLDRDEFLVEDPGRGTSTNPLGPVWWPAWLLYKAAEARSGGTAIFALLGRDTEGVTRTATIAGSVRTSPAVAASRKGTLVVGRTYTVTATANGGAWTIAGRTGKAWQKVKWGTGSGWVAGMELV
jgi:hypothetical protein